VEEVFKTSGVPTYTFVEPSRYASLIVALRTPGRGVVVEGPSGIGKSTAVARVLDEIADGVTVTKLSARDPVDVEYISLLPRLKSFGHVLVDDFHRLPDETKQQLADTLKRLADTEDATSKLIIVGINEAGNSLVTHAPDLANRIDTIRFEVEPPQAIEKLIALGESALNIEIEAKDAVAAASQGSFYIAQMLSLELCITDRVLEQSDEPKVVTASLSAVKRAVMERQEVRFGKALKTFVRGTKFRPSGRAPYLHILRWLRDSETWSISLVDERARHPEERISVGQVVDKGYLQNLIATEGISSILHFEPTTRTLSVEDPHLMFYLRNLDWPSFVRDAGFTRVDFDEAYDVALSFAGEDREYAEKVHDYLSDVGYAVFYDLAEQHRIISQNLELFLGPIYESGARYVVAVLGEKYGVKRWTKFESDRFKPRVDAGEVVPIWSKAIPVSAFDTIREFGGLSFDPGGDLDEQARHAAEVIARMLQDRDEGRLPLGDA
jgi:hypothetical protein